MTMDRTTICVLLLAASTAAQAQPNAVPITLLAQERVHQVEGGLVRGDHLWLSEAALKDVTGFELKPEGLCLEEICIPVPQDGSWEQERGGETFIDLSAMAAVMDQPLIREGDGLWSLGNAPVLRMGLESGLAPDFELPDQAGQRVRLSDFRGKKVLLLTWASW